MNTPPCLLDTGPLVALLDKSDQLHERTKTLFSNLECPFLTCEAVVTEAWFLVSRYHPKARERLIDLGRNGFYQIGFSLQDQWTPLGEIFDQYKDHTVSLADACLIRMAEMHNEQRILTFDSDFEVYRWGRNRKFEILSP